MYVKFWKQSLLRGGEYLNLKERDQQNKQNSRPFTGTTEINNKMKYSFSSIAAQMYVIFWKQSPLRGKLFEFERT
jgi:hypothetical protein